MEYLLAIAAGSVTFIGVGLLVVKCAEWCVNRGWDRTATFAAAVIGAVAAAVSWRYLPGRIATFDDYSDYVSYVTTYGMCVGGIAAGSCAILMAVLSSIIDAHSEANAGKGGSE